MARFFNTCFFGMYLVFSLNVSGQSQTYSNKTGGIEIKFPTGWYMMTNEEIANITSAKLMAGNGENTMSVENETDWSNQYVVSIVMNSREHPRYSIQIIS